MCKNNKSDQLRWCEKDIQHLQNIAHAIGWVPIIGWTYHKGDESASEIVVTSTIMFPCEGDSYTITAPSQIQTPAVFFAFHSSVDSAKSCFILVVKRSFMYADDNFAAFFRAAYTLRVLRLTKRTILIGRSFSDLPLGIGCERLRCQKMLYVQIQFFATQLNYCSNAVSFFSRWGIPFTLIMDHPNEKLLRRMIPAACLWSSCRDKVRFQLIESCRLWITLGFHLDIFSS